MSVLAQRAGRQFRKLLLIIDQETIWGGCDARVRRVIVDCCRRLGAPAIRPRAELAARNLDPEGPDAGGGHRICEPALGLGYFQS